MYLLTRLVLLVVVLTLYGCSNWRGIPTHGGGKRFDEEQRVIAGCIRRAIADMDVNALAGSTVLVNIDSVAHNGGGTIQFPGLNSITPNYSELETSTIDRITNTQMREGWGVSAGVGTATDLRPTVFTSEPDLKYLEASLGMKLRHCGVTIVTAKPKYILYVLVDVLGTNRSRMSHFVYWRDNLSATCEMTYYALDAKTNKLLFEFRRAAARSQYLEDGAIGFSGYHIDRSIDRIIPTVFPVNGEDVKVSAPPDGQEIEPNTIPESEFTKVRKSLDQKLKTADSYIQAGNLNAAERLINEVRSVDPEFPGLDGVNARFEAARVELGAALEEKKQNSTRVEDSESK